MRNIALFGMKKSGKSTAASFLKRKGYNRKSFSEPMKNYLFGTLALPYEAVFGASEFRETYVQHPRNTAELCRNAFNYTIEYFVQSILGRLPTSDERGRMSAWLEKALNGASVREMLQTFGTELFRDMYGEDVWVKAFFKNVNTSFVQKSVLKHTHVACRFNVRMCVL